MKEIRNCFNQDLKEYKSLAISLIAIRSLAKNKISDMKILAGATNFSILSSLPDSNDFDADCRKFLENTINLQEVLVNYDNHQGVFEELVHAKIIQRWYEFLSQLFKYILNSHFSNQKNYTTSKSFKFDTYLDLSVDTGDNIIQNIQERALEKFDFLKADDKLKQIEKILNKNVNNEVKKKIKKHIIVRNTWQHNNGIVRKYDLGQLGDSKIILMNDQAQELQVKENEKLIITYYELLEVNRDFRDVSNILIPND
ncbi:hypothetical protein FJR38_05870 [Anabaena sp. UHCC 0253]|uniref:hypothetical protein n=1 Tax=Anabaena sp. UHCC 0253 TaxID=2590019 RepID=UPI001446B059|nr:hypothetical protein [Anabaena sp. UHCC 0253]MTJ52233.1 hypothetical protein [Anabaena sp. UHCC 0253]